MGRDYQDEQLWDALRAAQFADTVNDMPQQLDSQLGRQGVRLSGGLRQRLAIARLLLNDPQVVIFDEATSALDTETEARLHEALKPFLEGCTVLIIVHRLSAVKQADHVYVFEIGQIAEQGTHKDLLKADEKRPVSGALCVLARSLGKNDRFRPETVFRHLTRMKHLPIKARTDLHDRLMRGCLSNPA